MSHPKDQVVLCRDELEEVIAGTVLKTLKSIGLDTTNPVELQRDFQTLREWREAMREVKKKGLLTLIGILVTGLAAALYIGVRAALTHP